MPGSEIRVNNTFSMKATVLTTYYYQKCLNQRDHTPSVMQDE